MLEPFLIRALVASLGLAAVAAPLGCFVVWQRLAYFGETVAQAGLIGVALGLALQMDVTWGVLVVALAVAALLLWFSRQRLVALDSILGLLHHAALAAGVIATSMIKGAPVDLTGFLFGDVFAVTNTDVAIIFVGGAAVLATVAWLWHPLLRLAVHEELAAGVIATSMIKGAPVDLTGFLFGDVFAVTSTDVAIIFIGGAAVLATVAWLWQPLLRLAVHEELAAAEGVDRETVRTVFIVLLAVTIAVAMKIVGILLVMAFLVVPAVAARPLSRTPERMVLLTGLIAMGSVIAGLWLSAAVDSPGGPSIVIVMSVLAGLSLSWAAYGRPGASVR